MSALPDRRGGDLTHFGNVPAGARQLGSRVKPIIRLGMGIKDPERGFPRKTDHFTVRGDERAVAKFKSVYGEQPKAVKLMVPSSLSLALDISYRSFIGGGDDEGGGRPLALGLTNFAPLGYVGGPDVLRVWKQDGSYMEVETLGLDEQGKPLDPAAETLNIEVYTTFTFTIPDVLGWGSFCQVTSKGRKSADNLSYKLTEVYSAFGSKAPWAFTREHAPQLVLKPDTAITRFEKDGKAGWGKVKIFVLDIVITEPFEDMQDRILERQRELGGAMGALYPTAQPAIAEHSSAPRPADMTGGPTSPAAEPDPSGGVSGAASAGDGPSDPIDEDIPFGEDLDAADEELRSGETRPVDEVLGEIDRDEAAAAEARALAAAMYAPSSQTWPAGTTIGQIYNDHGEKGREYIRFCLAGGAKKPEFVQALSDFTRFYDPALHHEALAQKAAQGS